MEAYERDRLLYVAATRARDHLLVSVFHTEPAKNSSDGPSDAQRLWEASASAPDLWRSLEIEGIQPTLRPAAPPQESARISLPDRDTWVAQRAALLARQESVSFVAATSLAGVDEFRERDETDRDGVFRRGRAGSAVGRAVHAVLQSADLATGANVARLAHAEAAAESVADRTAEVARLATAAIQSEPVRAAVASTRYWREVFVSAEAHGVLIEGFIDLLYESDAGLVIVDYKTDAAASDDEISAAMAKYRLQGAAYALALERNLGRPVAACRFLFLRPVGTRTVEIDDLPGATAQVDARLATIATDALVHSPGAGGSP
jgi:ATP-dependent helicase/nuclease subunit A